MSDHDSDTDTKEREDIRAEIMQESQRRHPAFLGRLETEEYYAIAHLFITELRPGDIIDIREFDFDVPTPDLAYVEISPNGIVSDFQGVYSINGKLPDGTEVIINRDDGLPMKRRRAVRYGRRMPI